MTHFAGGIFKYSEPLSVFLRGQQIKQLLVVQFHEGDPDGELNVSGLKLLKDLVHGARNDTR